MSNQSHQSTASASRSRRNRKIAAISAGALVVGLGAAYTLASWNDSEWVWGGADGDPNVGTSTFEVNQNTTSPFSNDAANWVDAETNPGGELTFSPGSLSLTPGDTIYAPVSLRTEADSDGAAVALQGAVAATGITVTDAGQGLWNAIQTSVYTQSGAADSTPPACTAAGIGGSDWSQVLDTGALGTAATGPQNLSADAGSTQHYCFALTLPTGSSDELQGRTIAPAWEFRAESVSD